MENIQQYQRAVTPTMGASTNDNAKVRGKMLSYSTRRGGAAVANSDSSSTRAQQQQHLPQPVQTQRVPRTSGNSLKSLHIGQSLEISGQSKPVSGNRVSISNSRQDIYGVGTQEVSREFNKISSYLPHQDLEPLSDSVPPDGVLFARYKNRPGSLVVFRLHDERARNPERLNLDRRQLDICPHLEQEERLRLLNFQNNNIRLIQNLENLPNLIFLDLYNNKLSTLEGSLSSVRGLRVLMVGKNRISEISNIATLKKLDVLDLHSNDISEIQGLDGLQDLRVLNLAGNSIPVVHNISMLSSLTELNLRRNNIEQVLELDKIPSLQRVFLSHNHISLERNIVCLYSLKLLIELSLDANPIAEENPHEYRILIIGRIPSLKHLDLRRVNEEEKALARANLSNSETLISDSSPQQQQTSEKDGGLQHHSSFGVRSESSSSSHHHHQQVFPQQQQQQQSQESQQQLQQEDAEGTNTACRITKTKMADELPGSTHENESSSGFFGVKQQSGGAVSAKERFLASDMQQKQGLKPHEHFFPPSNSDFKNALPQNAFDLEAIGNNEKSLVVIGENWEWAHSKRMLSSVTETYLRHMKKETIVSKFATNLAWLPTLNSLTLIDNDIKTFADLTFVLRPFDGSTGGGVIKHLYVAENPLCKISTFILKSYIATTIPHVESFNGISITLDEKERSSNVFKRILGHSTSQQPVLEQHTHLPFDPLLEDRSCRIRSSLENFSTGICFQENAWTNGLHEQSAAINYALQLQENSFEISSSELDSAAKKPVDKPPPPHSTPSFPSLGAEHPKKSTAHLLSREADLPLHRGDFEYNYPYKSALPQAPPTTFSSVAPLLPNQQMSLNSIANITQLVLQRRNIEEKFLKMFVRSVDSVLLDTISALQHNECAHDRSAIQPSGCFASWREE